MSTQKPIYGIALSGGGARALIHLGVLEALLINGIVPQIIAGSSMGALVGAFYAAGYLPNEIIEILQKERVPKYFNLFYFRRGFRDLQILKDILAKYLKKNDFGALKYPLIVSVTNLNTGNNEMISEGTLFDYLVASASMPILFKPKYIGGSYYVDGGVSNNMPVKVLKGRCEKIIGVHANHISKKKEISGVVNLAERIYKISIFNTVREEISQCDYLIDPPEARSFDTFDFSKMNDLFSLGFKEGLKLVKKIGEE